MIKYKTVIGCGTCKHIIPMSDIKRRDVPGPIKCPNCGDFRFVIERVPYVKKSSSIVKSKREIKYEHAQQEIVDSYVKFL